MLCISDISAVLVQGNVSELINYEIWLHLYNPVVLASVLLLLSLCIHITCFLFLFLNSDKNTYLFSLSLNQSLSSLLLSQLVFEAVRSGFDGQVTLDDVAFIERSCSLPSMCSFEGHTCGYSSSGDALWVHQNWDFTRTGPVTDHSLETKKGKKEG